MAYVKIVKNKFAYIILYLYLCCEQKPNIMRPADLKVQTIAREVGMLFLKDGREYAQPVVIDNLLMEFEYSNPDDGAYIAVYDTNSKSSRAINIYVEDFEDVRIDYPQFFEN